MASDHRDYSMTAVWSRARTRGWVRDPLAVVHDGTTRAVWRDASGEAVVVLGWGGWRSVGATAACETETSAIIAAECRWEVMRD